MLFFAGAGTLHVTICNLITELMFNPEEYKKIRSEIDPFMDKIKDDIMGKMTVETLDDLEYVKMCYQESMRKDSPAVVSSTAMLTQSA